MRTPSIPRRSVAAAAKSPLFAALTLLALVVVMANIFILGGVRSTCAVRNCHHGVGAASLPKEGGAEVRGVGVLVDGVASLADQGSPMRVRPHQALRLVPLLPDLHRAYKGDAAAAASLSDVVGVLDPTQALALRALGRPREARASESTWARFEAEVRTQAGRSEAMPPGPVP